MYIKIKAEGKRFTLPLPNSATQNREKVIQASRERYMKPVKTDQVESYNEVGIREKAEREAVSINRPAQGSVGSQSAKASQNFPRWEDQHKDLEPIKKPESKAPSQQAGSHPSQSHHPNVHQA